MINYIYCYTNLINNKKYIGQTNNLERRIREHKSHSFNPNNPNYNNIIHKAIRKYGYENFSIEVIETLIDKTYEQVNDREIYWIDQLKTLISQNGYNVLEGGKNAQHTLLKENDIKDIKEMIKKGTPYTKICNTFGLSKTFISDINTGRFFFEENEIYPLFKYRIDDDTYDMLIEDLEKPELTFKQLSVKYDMAESTIKKFNYGTLRPGFYSGTYPIRKLTPEKYKAQKIIDYLLNTNLSKKEIIRLTNSSDETVRRINLGITQRQDDLTYPLR